MQKGKSTSSEDVRSVGRMSLIGLEDGVDGIFTRRKDDIVERVITHFPVHDNSPSSRTDKLARPESYKRKSFPDDKNRTTQSSLPKSCVNCEQPKDFSKEVECNASSESPSKHELGCKKCGHVRSYSSGGTSLPGTPYSVHKTLEQSPFGLPSQRTAQSPSKLNGSINCQPAQFHGDSEDHLPKSRSPYSESKVVINGSIKSEHVLNKPDGVPPDSSGKGFTDLQYESPSALAQKLFNLDGFDRDEVAPELSKK